LVLANDWLSEERLQLEIVKRKQAEEQLRETNLRFDLAMKGANADGLWDWDVLKNKLWLSPRWKSMRGYKEDEISDELQEWSDRVHPDDLESAYASVQDHLNASAEYYESIYRIRHKDGHYLTILDRGFAVRDENGQAIRMVGTNSDITALREAEESLRMANQAKDDFLASMSHELRTPLTSIIGNSEFIAEKTDDPEVAELIRSIESAGRGQLALVNDIIDVSKIESGKFTIDEVPYEVSALLDDIDRLFTVRAQDLSIKFQTIQKNHEPYLLMGDSQRVAQIVINLVGNALKFTEGGGSVKLTSDVKEDKLIFTVEDSGIGMSPSTIEKLFQRFEQADGSISRRFGGSGLGLFISHNLAELMEGTIEVSSEEEVGSIFTVMLPYKKSDIAVNNTKEGNREYSVLDEKFTGSVLVVEDTSELQMLERRILEKCGLDVTTVNNGKEAVELAAQHSFDLILMDMQMPVMDGVEATRALRSEGNQVPVIALTANVMQKHRDAFDQAGCNGFIGKPIDRQELRRVLNQYLVLDQDRNMLDKLEIENRRKTERRAEEISVIKNDRTKPRRLKDRKLQAVSQLSPEVDEYIDDNLQKLFIGRLIVLNEQLVQAYKAEEWDKVRKVAHIVRGSAVSFGFPKLTQLGIEVCDAIDANQTADVSALAQALIDELGNP
jgi:PAS domain S-box-containing protein